MHRLSLLSLERGELLEEGLPSQQAPLAWSASPCRVRGGGGPGRLPRCPRGWNSFSPGGAVRGQRLPRVGKPAAGGEDSVRTNILIGSSFEGKLVQLQIQTVSKCA